MEYDMYMNDSNADCPKLNIPYIRFFPYTWINLQFGPIKRKQYNYYFSFCPKSQVL